MRNYLASQQSRANIYNGSPKLIFCTMISDRQCHFISIFDTGGFPFKNDKSQACFYSYQVSYGWNMSMKGCFFFPLFKLY